MNFTKKLLIALAWLPVVALGNEATYPLDNAPARSSLSSLQNGARLFINNCLNCHAASSMRYNRLRDLSLSEDQIKANLLFSGEKVGDLMTTAMRPADAKAWFGAVPPDLSVIARAKASAGGSGPDYLYTYLRTFYKDDSRPTGWNNLVLPNVAMPHVLWQMQGVRGVKMVETDDPHEHGKKIQTMAGFEQLTPGTMNSAEFDSAMADLVAYMDWMAEPGREAHRRLGVIVVMFLALFAFLAWRLIESYWKEVK